MDFLKKNGDIEVVVDISSVNVCSSCQLAKSIKLSFANSAYRAASPFLKINCDLWSPAPIVSIEGYKYYVIFVDDHTRFIWFYPFYSKSDFFTAYLHFEKLIERQFSAKLKCFQSDGGGELISHKFQKHLSERGIIHQISCPYTPEQNGLVKRRHRIIVETGLSHLFHSKVPTCFWVQSFQAAVYVINRRPSSLLPNNASPYFALFGQQPDYSDLRILYCSCFPCLRASTANKFQPRSLQCVFLGYKSAYKGYLCYNISQEKS